MNLGVPRVDTVRGTGHRSLRQHTKTWGGFETSFTQRERILTHQPAITSTTRQTILITPLELSQLRALNSQLLWLGRRPQWPRFMRTVWAAQSPRSSFSCGGHVHRCWVDHSTRWNFAGRWHASRLKRVARSSSATETKATADGDDEAVYTRLCLKEVLFWAAGFTELAIGSETNSCCFAGGLSWCLRRLGSLLVLLSWLEGRETWLGSACSQTKSGWVWHDDSLASFCGTAG